MFARSLSDRARRLTDHCLLIVVVLRSDHALLKEHSIARQGDFRVGERRLVFRQRSHRLAQRCLVGMRIDFDQQVALMHRLAFLEGDVHDLAVHPGLYCDGVESSHSADRVQIAVEIAALDQRGHDRHPRTIRDGRCFSGSGARGLDPRQNIVARDHQQNRNDRQRDPAPGEPRLQGAVHVLYAGHRRGAGFHYSLRFSHRAELQLS